MVFLLLITKIIYKQKYYILQHNYIPYYISFFLRCSLWAPFLFVNILVLEIKYLFFKLHLKQINYDTRINFFSFIVIPN